MSRLKDYITANYGVGIYKLTQKLKEMKKDIAKSKNQFIFLQRCVKHKIIAKSLRINCVQRGKNVKNLKEKSENH